MPAYDPATDEMLLTEPAAAPEFDASAWRATVEEEEPARPGARILLGSTLSLLSLGWLAYCGWSAGRALASLPVTSPDVAQWVAIAAAPLALFALVWIMFGRTRRREAEAFTRSVIAMKSEAHALESQLAALTQSLATGRDQFSALAGEVEAMATQRAEALAGVTRELGIGAETLAAQGERLDATTSRAREDMGVLMNDLPQAEERARAFVAQLEQAGSSAGSELEALEARLAAIGQAGTEAETRVRSAGEALEAQLHNLTQAGDSAHRSVEETRAATAETVDTLLERTADALADIRGGIDIQAAAVSALVAQAQAGMAHSGSKAAELLGSSIEGADRAIAALSERVAAQDEAGRRMLADLDSALAGIDERYSQLAADGDARAAAMASTLAEVRSALAETADMGRDQSGDLDALANRTRDIRNQVDALAANVRDQLIVSFNDAEHGAGRLLAAGEAARPVAEAVREATGEAADRLEASSAMLAEQQERVAALLGDLEGRLGSTGSHVSVLREALAAAQQEAETLSSQTSPALVDALVRVKDAAAHASERAREAIRKVIPETAGELSDATARALEAALREGVEKQLCEVDAQAARAIDAAKAASDRLAGQMLSIGQTAAALEAHLEDVAKTDREGASEDFARRVAQLMESMNSAAIDVGKILAEDVDEKSWNAYLKGERGVFTRRAVKLISSADARAIGQHYESDPEFHDGVNRYIHDFEAMLRRVLAERDGSVIAVTLMSSDMGKLYAALAQAVDRKL